MKKNVSKGRLCFPEHVQVLRNFACENMKICKTHLDEQKCYEIGRMIQDSLRTDVSIDRYGSANKRTRRFLQPGSEHAHRLLRSM
ncbi:YolD-like family protein [Sporolactobacillus nakayamae]|uniref:YolD-like family protein n=1 Tax=Sporolactobacillus nakayamae TaxID=269670 RepID=UPI003CCBC8B0